MSVLTAGRTQLLAGGSHALVSSRHGSPALERVEEERGERADGGEDAVVGRRVHAPVSSRHGSPALERVEEERGERADGGEDAVVGRRVACPGIVQARLTCP